MDVYDSLSYKILAHEHVDNSFESVITLSLDEHVEDNKLLKSVKWLDGHEELPTVKNLALN